MADYEQFSDYSEPTLFFEDAEYFAMTQPRPGIFRTWTEAFVGVCLALVAGFGASGIVYCVYLGIRRLIWRLL